MINMLGSALLLPFESLLNQLLKQDPVTLGLFTRFAGKELAIETSNPSLQLSLLFNSKGIHLTSLSAELRGAEPDATIRGDASTLLGLLIADSHSQGLANPAIEVRGDADFVLALMRSRQQADLNWDDILAPVLGGSITELMARGSDVGAELAGRMERSARVSVDDYLREELRLLPTRQASADFQDRLDALRLRLDRAEARVSQLRED